MENKKTRWYIIPALLIAMVWSMPAGAGTFIAGAAVADITPDVNTMKVPSGGYGDRGPKPMEGVLDPVRCKALVASDGESKAALVTCDLISISPRLRQKVLAGVAGIGIDDHNLMMAASHTHSGPGAMMKNAIAGLVFGRYNEVLVQQTADRIVSAIKEADAGMDTAVIKIAEKKLDDVTRNRRDPAGSYNYDTRRFNSDYDPNHPHNITDPMLTVVRFDGTDGSPIAVLFHFSAHGTVMGSDNMLFSADWAGRAQAGVEAAFPGTVAMYMTGAQGDQAPAMLEDDISDKEYLDIIGNKVADGVVSIMDRARPVEATPIRAIMVHREIPPGNKVMGMTVPKSLVKHYFPEMPLQVIRMGELVLMASPVEMMAEIGLAMKHGAKGQGAAWPLAVGVANGLLLYCVTPEEFPLGGYEVGNTIFGKIEAGILIGEQMMLVRRVLRE